MTDDAAAVGEFLDKFWGGETGKVYIATLEGGRRRSFQQSLAEWPLKREKIISFALGLAASGKDVFFCPSVFKEDAPEPKRPYVKSVNSHWLDFDGNAPEDWATAAKEKGVPEPSLIVQSSVPGQQHVYWFTERTNTLEGLDTAENITRNLTAAFGTDKAGWDLPQLLRIPYTWNYGFRPTLEGGEHKPWYQGKPVRPVILKDEPLKFEASVFSGLTNAERRILERIVIDHIPPIAEVMALGKWPKTMYDHFMMTEQEASDASPNKRSGSIQRLAYYGAENGFTDEQLYSILDDADRRWNKYIESHSKSGRDKILRDSIARARDKIGYLVGNEVTFAGILGEDTQNPIVEPQFVFSYIEFLNADFHTDWLLDGLIANRGLGLFVGQPGVGKTRIAIQIGMELAAGRERIVTWNNTTGPKKVGMLSLEMSAEPLGTFIGAFREHYQDEELQIDRNFHIAPIGSEVPLDTPVGQALVTNFLSEYKKDLLIIDSLQASVSKAMTDEIAMKEVFRFIAEIRKRFNCAIMFVHHERKRDQTRGGFSPGELSDVYGSQIINMSIDYAVSLAQNGDFVDLSETKNRLSQKQTGIHLINSGIRFVCSDVDSENLMGGNYGSGPAGVKNSTTLDF